MFVMDVRFDYIWIGELLCFDVTRSAMGSPRSLSFIVFYANTDAFPLTPHCTWGMLII